MSVFVYKFGAWALAALITSAVFALVDYIEKGARE